MNAAAIQRTSDSVPHDADVRLAGSGVLLDAPTLVAGTPPSMCPLLNVDEPISPSHPLIL